MGFLKSRLFVLYVNCNMLVCSLLFLPWALPRETVSGLLGRWKSEESGMKYGFADYAAVVVDALYFWEPNHCVEVYLQERDARKALYP